mmetsp:Transcript_5720/g.14268  ORF Transcript_5720/g.14268 Transcript_5720/m.14268 type:complete len:207 (-) Transcript_5720:367-987(-)
MVAVAAEDVVLLVGEDRLVGYGPPLLLAGPEGAESLPNILLTNEVPEGMAGWGRTEHPLALTRPIPLCCAPDVLENSVGLVHPALCKRSFSSFAPTMDVGVDDRTMGAPGGVQLTLGERPTGAAFPMWFCPEGVGDRRRGVSMACLVPGDVDVCELAECGDAGDGCDGLGLDVSTDWSHGDHCTAVEAWGYAEDLGEAPRLDAACS